MRILVTNDDGVLAAGVQALGRALAECGEVTVVAPDRERSATSHSLTLRAPLRVHWVSERVASVDGTPTDCVLLAVHALLERRPDLVVSGVNHGPNLGDDVYYSGTVAGAMEGALIGIPAIAVSLAGEHPAALAAAASFAARLAAIVAERGLRQGTLLNVNVPAASPASVKGVRWTRLGRRVYHNAVERLDDPGGELRYRICGTPGGEELEGTDLLAIAEGYVSVTPLHFDRTDHVSLPLLHAWPLEWRKE